MKRIEKISSNQMFSILLLSRMIALFTFMLPTTAFLSSGDRIITPLFLLVIELLYSFAVCLVIKKSKNRSMLESVKDISPLAGKITAIFYAILFVWFAGIAVSRFELFISTVMFPNSELYLMTVILLAAAFYAALKGIEALGRASVILAALLGFSILFIILTVWGNFEYTNLKPILTEGFSPIVKFSLYVSARASEFITLLINAPKINGSIKKLTVPWTVTVTVVTSIVLLILGGVTGEYGDDQIFPLYTLTVIAKFGILERLDDVLTGMWVLCSFSQLTFLLITSYNALEQGFDRIKKVPVCFVATTGVFGVYLFASKTVTSFSEIISSQINEVIFITALLLVPFIITLLYSVKKRRQI